MKLWENSKKIYVAAGDSNVGTRPYRLLAELQWRLDKFSERKGIWKDADAFINDLERVERVEVKLGHQVKNWHLNLTGMSDKTLEMIGFKGIFKETIEAFR